MFKWLKNYFDRRNRINKFLDELEQIDNQEHQEEQEQCENCGGYKECGEGDDEDDFIHYRVLLELDFDNEISVAVDVRDEEVSKQAFALFIYSGLKAPLQESVIDYLKQQNEPIFKDILAKLDMLKLTEEAINRTNSPVIGPLDIFNVIGHPQ